MGTAEDEGVDPRLFEGGEVLLGDQAGHLVVPLHKAVFDKRDKEGAGRRNDLRFRVAFFELPLIGPGADGGGGGDDPDLPAAAGGERRLHRGGENAGVGELEPPHQAVGEGGRDGAAGGDDHLHLPPEQEVDVLQGVMGDDLGAPGAVRDPPGVAEVDDILMRQHPEQFPHGG